MDHARLFLGRLGSAALSLVFLGALPRPSNAADSPERSWFLSLRLDDWRSGSAAVQKIRVRADNPYLSSRPVGVELGRRLRGSRWEGRYAFSPSFSSSVGFDDGTGRNRTLNQDSSRRSITALEGTLWRRLFGRRSWSFGLGPGAAFNYERLTLDFNEIGTYKTWTASLDVGVAMALEWRPRDRMRARMEVDNLLSIPWLSGGKRSTPLAETSIWTLGLRSRLSLSASRAFRNGMSIELVFRRDERLEVDAPRGVVLDFNHSTPPSGALTRDNCWIVRLGIRP
jgi:hypothetical protein